MSNAKNVYAITFTSGTTILSTVNFEDDKQMLLKNPMEMILDSSNPEVQMFYLIRWMPFSEEYMTLIYRSSIESITKCSDKFVDIFNRKIARMEAIKEGITDPDVVDIEGSMDNDDGGEESTTDMDNDSEQPIGNPRTYH